ncbi:hypothetical protein [Zobellella aerophila]|uniref:DUF2783 domain-containing protein n=1 Tax=Zobellella aerophila TaxID=870480 RepID=A0ABP6VTH5_9GAMM
MSISKQPSLSIVDLELCYDRLAETLDEIGTEQESLFLTKLVLYLANQTADGALVEAAIAQCRRDLPC